jgi:hypothetical protein
MNNPIAIVRTQYTKTTNLQKGKEPLLNEQIARMITTHKCAQKSKGHN